MAASATQRALLHSPQVGANVEALAAHNLPRKRDKRQAFVVARVGFLGGLDGSKCQKLF